MNDPTPGAIAPGARRGLKLTDLRFVLATEYLSRLMLVPCQCHRIAACPGECHSRTPDDHQRRRRSLMANRGQVRVA